MVKSAFSSKIFLDGGVSEETAEAKKLLGFLDGQTTNPTLIAKNLLNRGVSGIRYQVSGIDKKKKILNTKYLIPNTEKAALEEYKRIVRQMSKVILHGSVSIQVFADQKTKTAEMIKQARVRRKWIPNSSIKIPCVAEGLKAGEILCKEMPLNFTLVFSQSQAAAVYEATKGAKYPVFVSPFVGRLDDGGEKGMDVIANILRMYEKSDHHIEVLTASVRNLGHIFRAFELKSNIITIPFKILKEWASLGFPTSLKDTSKVFRRDSFEVEESAKTDLLPIYYDSSVRLGQPWQSYDLHHDLTDKGVTSFWTDWMGLFS